MHEEKPTELALSTTSETALDVGAAITSLVPWLGGPVGQVLSGLSIRRKMARVKEILDGLADDLKDLRSDESRAYVQKEEFQELLERTLLAVADEKNDEKRHIYRAFLTGAIARPGGPYDEQVRFLRTLQEIQSEHIRILKATMQAPEQYLGVAGSQIQTLSKRIPDLSRERIQYLVGQLNDMRLTRLTNLTMMLTAGGAADLRRGLTPYGQRFVAYL